MIPLYRDPVFTFRFEEDRLIDRFHLEGVGAGLRVTLFRWQADISHQAGPELARCVVGEGGWVTLSPPMVMRAGEGFVVSVQPG